jgi:hypothetical protein
MNAYSLDPKKRPGSRPKMDEAARRLLKADLRERPTATLPRRCEVLGSVAGVSVRDSTVSRMLGGLGSSRKKIGMSGRARRVPEGRLAHSCRRGNRRRAAGVCGRDGRERLLVPAVRLGAGVSVLCAKRRAIGGRTSRLWRA